MKKKIQKKNSIDDTIFWMITNIMHASFIYNKLTIPKLIKEPTEIPIPRNVIIIVLAISCSFLSTKLKTKFIAFN